jgi:alkylhydroperoxidase family enzyme
MESDGGEAKLSEVATWRDSQLFSEAERVALEYAERVTITDQKVDDAFFSRLKQHYSEAQIVELTAAIAFENYRSKVNPSLGVDAQGFCMMPRR